MKSELLRIEIPNYITHVLLSKHRRAKYYTKVSKKIPKKYDNPNYGFNKKGVLINLKTKEPVIANPRVAGQPRYKKINGQDLYRGNNNPYIRSKMIRSMKTFFRKEIDKLNVSPINDSDYPVEMELELHTNVTENDFDMDNAGWVYVKVIQDVLVEFQIIRNDTKTYLAKTGGVQYVPVKEGEPRKLVIILRRNMTPFRNQLREINSNQFD